MEPIDLQRLNKTAYSRRLCEPNDFTGRQIMLPRCSKKWGIRGGPSFPRICSAPADTLSWELSRRHGFRHADKRISEKVPVEFSLHSGSPHKYVLDFSVEAVIWAVDTYPDLYALEWSVFGRHSDELIKELEGCIALRGCFRAISNEDRASEIPEGLKGRDYKECVIVYDPRRPRGWLCEVASAQELPACGVIKDLYVLHEVVRKFSGGFIETNAPDGVCHWGRLSGGNTGSWISCDAVRDKEQQWKYAARRSDDGWSLNLIGVRHRTEDRMHWDELVGDAFLCSDGTVLHSYYFSRKGEGEMPPIPEGFKDGYYHNRLYPPGSLMVPKHITDSFEREMPAWFYKEDKARQMKTQKLA